MSIKNGKYHDPLHVPSAQLVVTHKGKEVLMISKALLDRQNCWENLEKIKDAYSRKLFIYDEINETTDKTKLRELGLKLREIEFELQGYWKFSIDAKFHRFWEYPKCECPKLDNMDDYPHLQHINLSCPLHGD